jgi:dTMP kinase
MNKGMFITFEGGEGGGKTTQAKILSEWMNKRGIENVLTREPGNPYIEECAAIRELLLNPLNNLDRDAELLLFLADRAQHTYRLILPSLNAGKHVICDRYADSTRIYQCCRGLGRDKVDRLIEFATSGLTPNLTFVLDIPVEIGLQRVKENSIYKEGDRMEMAGQKFHNDVRYGFLKLSEEIGQTRFNVIDVAPPKTIKCISDEIIKIVSRELWAAGYRRKVK